MNLPIEVNQKLVIRFLKKYLFLILLFGLLCGVGSAFVTFELQTTKYESTGTLVQNDNNYSLVQSYKQFSESSRFKKIIDNQIDKSSWKHKDYKYDYKINFVSSGTTSPFFQLTAVSENPKYAKYLATTVSQLFITDIGKYLSVSNVSIVSTATRPTLSESNMSSTKVASSGFIIGVLLAGIVSFIGLIRSGKITDTSYVEDIYGLKLLGTLGVAKRK